MSIRRINNGRGDFINIMGYEGINEDGNDYEALKIPVRPEK